MAKLTLSKAKKLVKRELGISPASLEQKGHPDYPYYEMASGNMSVTVMTRINQCVTQMYISWNTNTITTHFYTDTLAPFLEADTLHQCEVDDENGDSPATAKACDNMTYQLNRHYNTPQMSRWCRVCGCNYTADKQVHWLHHDMCYGCGVMKIETGCCSYNGNEV